jgi:hypothetical protein
MAVVAVMKWWCCLGAGFIFMEVLYLLLGGVAVVIVSMLMPFHAVVDMPTAVFT